MDLVTCSIEDGIAQVRLNRPDKLNALTLPMLEQLTTTADRLRKDRTLRAVVLAGAGESFTAGLDFATVMKNPSKVATTLLPRPWRRDLPNGFQAPAWAWRRVPVPVIAAVRGHCLGGGVQLALGADYRFTTATAQWSVLEAKWGLIPDMSGIAALTQLVGIDRAKRLTMTGEMFTGEQAVAWGVASELADDPIAAATEFALLVAQRSPDSVAASKRLFERSWHSSARATLGRERRLQVGLLAKANTTIARTAAFAKGKRSNPGPDYLPRGQWMRR